MGDRRISILAHPTGEGTRMEGIARPFAEARVAASRFA